MLGERVANVGLLGEMRSRIEDLRRRDEELVDARRERDASDAPRITVVTVTREHPELLHRAIQSVDAQHCTNPIEHLIVVDDDDSTLRALELCATPRAGRSRAIHLERRPPGDDPLAFYPRLARLFNRGVELARGQWIAFLDDDNVFAPDHLSSLIEHAQRTGVRAVHSGRTMHWPDGSPYLEQLFPHARSPKEARRIYNLLCDRGVWIRGSNVVLDRADPHQTGYCNSTVMADDDPVMLVDQNVWLIERRLLLELPIPIEFSPADIAAGTAPDDKLIELLLRNSVAIETTRRPTVQYYLGGQSNRHNARILRRRR